ncbi:hypothetical protein [Oryza sativa Japonica Group]|uniref:Uncharacterized protein n=1 Tax=Oryza sativa subsp. japonica TaxID=39947 RepID=Q5JN96_ORYSJ|nr:hypothetical protein [Oryza sativa Japonica Group]
MPQPPPRTTGGPVSSRSRRHRAPRVRDDLRETARDPGGQGHGHGPRISAAAARRLPWYVRKLKPPSSGRRATAGARIRLSADG